MLEERVLAAICGVLPEATALYLFGSEASGETHLASDIDLAVLAPRVIPSLELWEKQEAVADTLHRDVHLIDLRGASTVLRVEVIRGGRLLLDTSPADRALFEATSLSAYAHLQEERRGILEDVVRTGSVHG